MTTDFGGHLNLVEKNRKKDDLYPLAYALHECNDHLGADTAHRPIWVQHRRCDRYGADGIGMGVNL